MNKNVLDSSALLAFINQEQGAEIVEQYLPNAIMSSVNIAEVVAVLSSVDIPEDVINNIIEDLDIEVIDFDLEQGMRTGFLRSTTKSAGLSFGDRACINLASIKHLPAVIADKAWKNLNLTANIILIR